MLLASRADELFRNRWRNGVPARGVMQHAAARGASSGTKCKREEKTIAPGCYAAAEVE